MILALLISSLLLQAPCADAPAESVTLDNGEMTAVITAVQGVSRAGTILELVDTQTGIDFAEGGNYASVHCGDYVPSDGELTVVSPSCAVFESPSLVNLTTRDELPVAVTATYRLVGRGLEVTYGINTLGTADLVVPLQADFGLKPYLNCFIKFANQTVDQDRRNSLSGQHEVFRVSGDQEVILYGSSCPVDTRYFFGNPSKAIIAVSAEDYPENEVMSLRFFDTEPPRASAAGPDLHSRLGPGNSSSYYVRMAIEDDQVPIYFSNHPNGWERSASWILDEIPMIHPNQGYMWAFSETSADSEYRSASIIRLLEEHPTMNMNILILPDGILAPNCDSMWYEPGYQDSWSHWHGTWRVSTQAPQDFLTWLKNIQDDVYPWADRVNLGCHGYHHTPSPDSAWDPFHEFITLEYDEHEERFDMIQSDYADMGLDPQMTSRTMRPSGNEMSLSGLWAMIDHGFQYYSNGARWNEWMAGQWFYDLYLSKYETPNGRIWGANTVWWADASIMLEYDKLSTVMERGKYGLLGGHPGEIFLYNQQENYDRIDSVCTSLEEDYPHFGWIMPVDYSTMMEEFYNTRIDSMRSTGQTASIYFTGSTGMGQTVVCRVPGSYTYVGATVDGSPADMEDHGGGRIFVDADGLSYGSHCVRVFWDYTGIGETPLPAEALKLTLPNPAYSSSSLNITGLQPGTAASIAVFDLSGRAVSSFFENPGSDGSLSTSLNLPSGTPSGIYFVRVSQGAEVASSRIVLLE